MIVNQDVVFKVSDELGYTLTEEQMKSVIEKYPSYQEKYPNEYYDEVIERVIEEVLELPTLHYVGNVVQDEVRYDDQHKK
jgi:hypothetical protein